MEGSFNQVALRDAGLAAQPGGKGHLALAVNLKEIGQGRSYGPFDSPAAFVASLRSESKKLRRKKSKHAA